MLSNFTILNSIPGGFLVQNTQGEILIYKSLESNQNVDELDKFLTNRRALQEPCIPELVDFQIQSNQYNNSSEQITFNFIHRTWFCSLESQLIQNIKSQVRFSEQKLLNIIKSVLTALKIYQRSQISFGRIELKNIVNDVNGEYKLADTILFSHETFESEKPRVDENIYQKLTTNNSDNDQSDLNDLFALGLCILSAASLEFYDEKQSQTSSMLEKVKVHYSNQLYNFIFSMIQSDSHTNFIDSGNSNLYSIDFYLNFYKVLQYQQTSPQVQNQNQILSKEVALSILSKFQTVKTIHQNQSGNLPLNNNNLANINNYNSHSNTINYENFFVKEFDQGDLKNYFSETSGYQYQNKRSDKKEETMQPNNQIQKNISILIKDTDRSILNGTKKWTSKPVEASPTPSENLGFDQLVIKNCPSISFLNTQSPFNQQTDLKQNQNRGTENLQFNIKNNDLSKNYQSVFNQAQFYNENIGKRYQSDPYLESQLQMKKKEQKQKENHSIDVKTSFTKINPIINPNQQNPFNLRYNEVQTPKQVDLTGIDYNRSQLDSFYLDKQTNQKEFQTKNRSTSHNSTNIPKINNTIHLINLNNYSSVQNQQHIGFGETQSSTNTTIDYKEKNEAFKQQFPSQNTSILMQAGGEKQVSQDINILNKLMMLCNQDQKTQESMMSFGPGVRNVDIGKQIIQIQLDQRDGQTQQLQVTPQIDLQRGENFISFKFSDKKQNFQNNYSGLSKYGNYMPDQGKRSQLKSPYFNRLPTIENENIDYGDHIREMSFLQPAAVEKLRTTIGREKKEKNSPQFNLSEEFNLNETDYDNIRNNLNNHLFNEQVNTKDRNAMLFDKIKLKRQTNQGNQNYKHQIEITQENINKFHNEQIEQIKEELRNRIRSPKFETQKIQTNNDSYQYQPEKASHIVQAQQQRNIDIQEYRTQHMMNDNLTERFKQNDSPEKFQNFQTLQDYQSSQPLQTIQSNAKINGINNLGIRQDYSMLNLNTFNEQFSANNSFYYQDQSLDNKQQILTNYNNSNNSINNIQNINNISVGMEQKQIDILQDNKNQKSMDKSFNSKVSSTLHSQKNSLQQMLEKQSFFQVFNEQSQNTENKNQKQVVKTYAEISQKPQIPPLQQTQTQQENQPYHQNNYSKENSFYTKNIENSQEGNHSFEKFNFGRALNNINITNIPINIFNNQTSKYNSSNNNAIKNYNNSHNISKVGELNEISKQQQILNCQQKKQRIFEN